MASHKFSIYVVWQAEKINQLAKNQQ